MSIQNNSWQDTCVVTIAKSGGSEVAIAAKTRDITIGGGERGLDVLNVNSGQIAKHNRQEPFEIGFDNVIPLYVDDFRQKKEGGTDASQPIQVTAGTSRDPYRIAILWANTTGVAGEDAVANVAARRTIIKDCYFTSMEENWADQLLEGNATFMVPALDLTGGGNVMWESNTGSGATMTALTAYTGGNFK